MNIAVSNDQSLPLSHDPCPKKRTLVVGTGPFVAELLGDIKQRPDLGYNIIGLVGDQEYARQHHPMYRCLGSLEALQDIIATMGPDHIIVALDGQKQHLYSHALVQAKICKNIVVEDGRKTYERITGEIPLEEISAGGVIFSSDFEPSKFSLGLARLFSFVFAALGLAVVWPILLLVSVAIRLDSKGGVFFIQERVGLRGKPFKLLKFRTMHPPRGKVSEWAGDNSNRITRVGHYLRKFRLDELPQFINVLLGHMNLVGPRPHPISNLRMLYLVSRNTPDSGAQIPYYSLRTMVRPGITGWAQVRYRYANNIDEEIEKLRFDLYYVKHYSLWLDLRILFETIAVVVTGSEGSQDQVEEQAQKPAARAQIEHKPKAETEQDELDEDEDAQLETAAAMPAASQTIIDQTGSQEQDDTIAARNDETEESTTETIETIEATKLADGELSTPRVHVPLPAEDLPQFSRPKLVVSSNGIKTKRSDEKTGQSVTGGRS